MNRAGYSTVSVDRLGTGQSSKPLSGAVTAAAEADAMHQVVTALRRGSAGTRSYSKVVIGGHSLGSTVTNTEASTYRDVDAVLLTGFTNNYNPAGLARFFASLYPAATDPALAGRGIDPGTSPPAPAHEAPPSSRQARSTPQCSRLMSKTRTSSAAPKARTGSPWAPSPHSRATSTCPP